MQIAVMSSRPDIEGTVPDRFEDSPALIIWETDTEEIVSAYTGESAGEYAARIAASEAEAVVCGKHIGKECFEPIADACISRYDGTGMSVPEAAYAALMNRIPMIPEYEGGPGCGSGKGECDPEHHH